ncbi:MAG: helix-turn-helix domain-containing protein [Prevotellaceae bacterium]|jgi:excisionase family DNA binding protein|nr:helix-turn-helix domain-containing protein [Prevotellaceae bacterium]
MVGNFEYKKVCKCCGKTFTAYKSTTNYCCTSCANRAYKADLKAKQQQADSEEIREHNRQKLLSQEFLSISSAAALLSISRPTIYKMIANGELKTIRISKRIVRVKRADLEQLQPAIAPINTPIVEINKTKEEYIGVSEALQQFKISLTWFYRKIKTVEIQPTTIDGKTLYPLKPLKKLFAKKQYADIAEWYTVSEIVEKFGVSKQYVYEYTSDHKLPRKRQGKEVLISKFHWDQSKGLDPAESENYYTVPQATEKYGIGRGHLYDLIRAHKIPKITRGRNIMIHRERLDKIMNNRKK